MILGASELPQEDLDSISSQIKPFVAGYKDAQILVYGGTGFVGSWLISGLLNANVEYSLNLMITIVTRDVRNAMSKFGSMSNQLEYLECDLAASEPKSDPIADFVFLGSTPTRNSTGSSNFEAVIKAAGNAANHASKTRSNKFEKPFVLHMNSGAIYGKQPMDMNYRSETDSILQYSSDSYTKSKLLIDEILKQAHYQGEIYFNSPRLFAFAGPLISLNEHFAVGNFIHDALNGREIQINGNPNTVRSYMYPTDLVCILLKVIQSTAECNVNIGSDELIKLGDLAVKISNATSGIGVHMVNPGEAPSNYVPSIRYLREEVWPSPLVSLDLALEKWISWLQNKGHPSNGHYNSGKLS